MTPKGGIRPHKKFGVQANKAEVLFTDYIAEHLNKNGRAGIVVPNGIVATTQTAYKQLRKLLVDDSLIAVISLPAGCFNPYSGVKTSVLMLDKGLIKKSAHVLFIKIANDGFDLGAQRREHDKNDLPLALEAFNAFKESISSGQPFDEDKYSSICTLVEKEKVLANKDIVLSGDRYLEGKISQTEFEIVKIEDVAEVMSGQSPESLNYNDKGEGLPFYQGRTDFGQIFLDAPTKWTTQITKEAYKNDILMSVRAPVGPVNIATEKICIGRGLAAIRPKENIELYYLFYMLRSLNGIIKGNGGAVFDSISRDQIKGIEIPLPPLEIQEQIVKEIEGYQKIIDGAKMVVDNYKPTISIKPEWEMVELGGLYKNLDGKRKPVTKSDRTKGIYPYYGASGIVDYVEDFIYDEELLLVSEDGANLLARSTPIAFSVNGKIWVNNHAHVLKFENRDTQRYIEIYLNSIDISMYVTGAAQPKLNQQSLNRIFIPLPSLNKQAEIVKKIDLELQLVLANKQLITIFEQKIKDKINEVWGLG
jgi:type I restriction enzyme M protein